MTRIALPLREAKVPAKHNGHTQPHEMPERPPFCWDRLPKELRQQGQFTLYREENGRKIPYRPSNPTQRAAINKPSTWADFDAAVRAFDAFPNFDGINAVCTAEFTFVDIDDCVGTDANHISATAQETMASLPRTYWEVSPSRKGLHGIFRSVGEIANIGKSEGGALELYSHDHFMSVTGWSVSEGAAIASISAEQVEPFWRKRASAAPSHGSPIPAGQRTNTLVSIAGTMRKRGLSVGTAELALRQHNAEHCSPPLPDSKIRSILKSAEKWTAGGDLLSQELKDVGNADRLLLWGEGNYRYVPSYGRWAVHDGSRWPVEDRQQEAIRSEAHEMFRAFAIQAIEASNEKAIKFAAESLDSPRITRALREAQPKAILRIEELDRDPLLLNFRNGTLDARTGRLREHRREDYITALIPYEYHPKAQCRKWENFIRETFCADAPMIEFIQRALGYSLTGDTSEKCMFLAHGPKDTAKTTLLATVKQLLGDYAGRIQVQSLMIERGRPMDGNAQSDLADLRGTRFVTTSETGQGQRLREELIKLLSQGQGDYRAVRKYENPFSFRETWKLWLDCNHLPVVHGTDDAIWERLIVVPFTNVIAREKQNRSLGKELMQEGEGILAWMVRGLSQWMKKGLATPDCIRQANTQWRRESDDLGMWLEECCVRRNDAKEKSVVLYSSYKFWRAQAGLYEESIVLFARKMKEHGFTKKEEGRDKVTYWQGIGIKA